MIGKLNPMGEAPDRTVTQNRASQKNYDPVKGDFFLELSSINLHLFTLEYLFCVTNMESVQCFKYAMSC